MHLPPTAAKRLLVADDDREVRLGVVELFDPLGFEVLQVESGTEALEVARRIRLHVAVLDVHMPGGCTGVEAIPQLRQINQGLACIVYSGRWSEDMESDALSCGAFACLKKPVDPFTLRRTVYQALGLSFEDKPLNN
jgi:CheY-like chemotaxis protein